MAAKFIFIFVLFTITRGDFIKQEPPQKIPEFLSENGRALPRKINTDQWLNKYKQLLNQWSSEKVTDSVTEVNLQVHLNSRLRLLFRVLIVCFGRFIKI